MTTLQCEDPPGARAYTWQHQSGDRYPNEGVVCAGTLFIPQYNETLVDDKCGGSNLDHLCLGGLLCRRVHYPSPILLGMVRGRTGQLSHRNWYASPACNTPVLLPRQEEYGTPHLLGASSANARQHSYPGYVQQLGR